MTVKEYIDTDAVADLTGLSRSTLEKWRLRDDRIPFIKAGRVVRYRIEDVRSWMEAHRVLSTSDPARASQVTRTANTDRQVLR